MRFKKNKKNPVHKWKIYFGIRKFFSKTGTHDWKIWHIKARNRVKQKWHT